MEYGGNQCLLWPQDHCDVLEGPSTVPGGLKGTNMYERRLFGVERGRSVWRVLTRVELLVAFEEVRLDHNAA